MLLQPVAAALETIVLVVLVKIIGVGGLGLLWEEARRQGEGKVSNDFVTAAVAVVSDQKIPEVRNYLVGVGGFEGH